MYATIRSAIIGVIENQSEKIEAAYRTQRSEVAGYPAAVVFPSEAPADYNETSHESDRKTFVFTIQVFYPFVDGQDAADIALEEAVDELLEIFQDKTVLGSACDWIEPVPSTWGYQTRGEGTMRMAELKIRAIKYT